jgi:hypothetical protein
MAKKTRRQKEAAQQRAIRQATANVTMAATAAPAAAAPSRPTADLREEYKHVRADLRRIVMLATGIIAVLVALSFVI